MALQDGDGSTPEKRTRPVRQAPPDTRPHIPVGVDLERMTDAAIGALATDPRVYQRGGMLVGVVTVPEGPAKLVRGVKRAPGSQVIVPLEAGTVRERLSSAARWTKYDGRKDAHTGTLPPEAVVSAVLGRREWGGVRSLVSVATSPQLRPDGTILQTPGYDAATGALYWPSESFPDVAEEPSLDAARGALEAMREVCCDFPFARPEHESAWIAGLLTMLARPAIDGPVPLFAVDATTAGTGKGRLVNAAGRIVLGHDIASTALPEKDEEMRKRITAIAIDGDAAVCLDNVRHKVDMPSLESVLTTNVWKDRVMGLSKNLTVTVRSVWWLTANNVELGGDLPRRTLHVRLESRLESPEERRDFKHPDLLAWIGANRRRLVASALTLLRAFTHAGSPMPPGMSLWGSFEEWTRLVPAALVWAGMSDPMLVRASAQAGVSQDRGNLLAVLDGIRRLRGAHPATGKELIADLFASARAQDAAFDDAREAIETVTRAQPGKLPEHTKLGYYLRKAKGRVAGGMRLVAFDPGQRVIRWLVEDV
jgi:hypothetical protein